MEKKLIRRNIATESPQHKMPVQTRSKTLKLKHAPKAKVMAALEASGLPSQEEFEQLQQRLLDSEQKLAQASQENRVLHDLYNQRNLELEVAIEQHQALVDNAMQPETSNRVELLAEKMARNDLMKARKIADKVVERLSSTLSSDVDDEIVDKIVDKLASISFKER